MIWYFSLRVFFKNSHRSILFFNKHLLSSALTILSNSLCTIAFQLLAYQKEFDTEFSEEFQNILSLIKSTTFRSATVKFKERQIRFNSVDTHNFFFSSDWVVDKIKIRAVIKQFFKDIIDYRLVLSKKTEISTLFIFAFTEDKFLTSQLIHIKKNSSVSDDIFIIWSNIDDTCRQNSNTMSDQSESSKNVIFNFDIISEQMQTLFDTLTVAMNTKINRLSNELRQLLQFISQQSSQSQQIFKNDVMKDRSSKDLISEKVEFFDSTAEEFESVINLSKHVFYRNVYAFVNKFKNVSFIREKDKLRLVIFQCFRDIVFIWHSTEFFDIEKEIYRDMFLQNWCNVFIKRFKKRASAILNYVQFIKYTLENARKHKNFRIYAQNLFKHVKTADFISIYNQLVLIWNNLNWQFKQHVSQSIEITIIQIFLEQLNNNCDIWFELVNANQFTFKRYNKQSTSNKYTDRHFNSNDRYFSYKSNAYQKNSQSRQISHVEVIVKLKNSKFESSERESERDNKRYDKNRKKYDQNKKEFNKDRRNYDKSRKKYDKSKYERRNKIREKDKNKEKSKAQIYITQKNDDHENSSNYHDLNYFDSDYKKSSDSECIIDANYTSLEVTCRRCQSFFSSNNLLHKHIRVNICSQSLFNFSKSEKNMIESSAYNTTENIRIIRFKINSNKNIESEYDFREWQYVTASVTLSKNETSKSAYLDTEAEITLVDIQYFKIKFKDILIRTMTSFITVRDLKAAKHSTNKYACCFMYFSKKNENDQSVFVEIIKEIHLIDNLKVNFLIDNDVLDFEFIDIFTFINTIFIESCNVIISIVVKFRSFSQIRSIHTTKENKISSHSELTISIHKIVAFDRDYIFESKKIANFAVYAHLMNNNIKTILVRNDTHKTVQISKNFRLKDLIEIDFSNAMHVNTNYFNLILKRSKYFHKSFWLQKAFKASVFHDSIESNILSSRSTKHSNEIIIHRFSIDAVKAFIKIINEYADLWSNQEFANLSQENWMQIFLRNDWEKIIKEKAKIYSLRAKDRLIVDEIFNKLHDQERLSWTTKSISFSFLCFVVWKNSSNNRKDRVIIDIRALNAVFLSNFYFISLQTKIIQIVHDCTFIFTIDCISFFYQWRIHFSDRHKMTVVTHRGQETFNVAVMKYKNSFVYVQRQIDRVLRFCRKFARVYIDDVVIFFKILNEHLTHLRSIFSFMSTNNISINSVKAFIDYSFVNLLRQHVNSLNLFIDKDKIKIIFEFIFSQSLNDFETYLSLTDWFRDYIKNYVIKSESLQSRKTTLLKNSLKSENARRAFATKIKFSKSTTKELNFFHEIQQHFFKSGFLRHFDFFRQLFVNLNTFDKNIDVMIYHINKNSNFDIMFTNKFSSRKSVEFILFFSRLLNTAESKYWLTKLEIIDLIWIIRKIRYMIESFKASLIFYTDHEASLKIAKQTLLTTFSTNKLNLRLVKVFDYIQRFDILIRHKFEIIHIVSDALSRLSSSTISITQDEKLNVLFVAFMTEMREDFRQRLLDEYITNQNWQRIIKILDSSKKNNIRLSFEKINDFIYRKELSDETSLFVSRRMCVSHSMIDEILSMIHNNEHFDFDKTYERTICSWYIRDLIDHLKRFLKNCAKCNVNRTRRHRFFDSLQLILSSSISFHTLIIDFVLALSESHIDLNVFMSIICKFNKRITAISEKDIWKTSDWATIMLERLNLTNWRLLKIIISDRNRKFLSNLWIALFDQLEVKLLYFIVYHFQIDDASERTNQTLKIALRYHLMCLKDSKNWSTVVDSMQRDFNNTSFFIITKTFNEICYDFTSCTSIDLINSSNITSSRSLTRQTVEDSIAFS